MAAELGVVVMAYGTPASPADVEGYYTHIRRGRAPAPEQLADLVRRYDAIGGTSPLAERTEAQRAGLAAALDQRRPGGCQVVLGQKHAAPFIEDAVHALADDGVSAVVGLVLAPHFSRFSVGQYQARLTATATERSMQAAVVDSWHLEPTYLEFLAAAVTTALEPMPQNTKVVFTAHSLPERALVDDPYPEQLLASASAVADAAGLHLGAGWALGWQSAGRTPEPWRGPDILEVIRDLATTPDVEGLVVCPQGFVSDHLEVVYDLDIEASQLAAAVGLRFARTAVLNAEPSVLTALADRLLATAP